MVVCPLELKFIAQINAVKAKKRRTLYINALQQKDATLVPK
jgi:hypothetical protein